MALSETGGSAEGVRRSIVEFDATLPEQGEAGEFIPLLGVLDRVELASS